MHGTYGSGSVSSTDDVLEMNVVRGVRGVVGVCEMCLNRGVVADERIGFGQAKSCGNRDSM